MLNPHCCKTILLLLCLFAIKAGIAQPSYPFYPRTVTSSEGRDFELVTGDDPLVVSVARDWFVRLPKDWLNETLVVEASQRRAGVTVDPVVVDVAGKPSLKKLSSVILGISGVWTIKLTVGNVQAEEQVTFKVGVVERDSPLLSRSESSDAPSGIVWSPAEITLLESLSLSAAGQQTDTLSGAAESAASLGHLLFYDDRISGSGSHSCASCHRPDNYFASYRPELSGAKQELDVPSLIGVSLYRWFNRNGSKDSLWSQAQGPLEKATELAGDRASLVRLVVSTPKYLGLYRKAYGEPPRFNAANLQPASPDGSPIQVEQWLSLDGSQQRALNSVFTNILKSFAAYQQRLSFTPSRFDRFVGELAQTGAGTEAYLVRDEQIGLKLFLSGSTGCLNCHSGPFFSDNLFHNVGTNRQSSDQFNPDVGREAGVERLLSDPFNCRSEWSERTGNCSHLDTAGYAEIPYLLPGAFRTPTLRNIAMTAPYMHNGSQQGLLDVISHYREPPDLEDDRLDHELTPIRGLTETQALQLVLFLESLTSEIPENNDWFRAPR